MPRPCDVAAHREQQQFGLAGDGPAKAKPIDVVVLARQRSARRPASAAGPAHCDAVQASPKRGSKLSSITAITASRSAMPPARRRRSPARSCASASRRARGRRSAAARGAQSAAAAAARRRRAAARRAIGRSRAPRPAPRRRSRATSSARDRGRRFGGRKRAQVVEGRDRVTAIVLHEKLAMSPHQRDRDLGLARRRRDQRQARNSRRAAPPSRWRGRARRRGRRGRR